MRGRLRLTDLLAAKLRLPMITGFPGEVALFFFFWRASTISEKAVMNILKFCFL